MLEKIKKIIKNKKNIWYLVGVFVLILIVSGGKNNQDQNVRDTVYLGDVKSSINLSGTVLSSENASLAFNASGIVSNVYVKEGDTVNAGDRLAEINTSSLRADLMRAQANLDLERASADVSNAEIDREVENAYIALLNNDLRAYPKNEDDDYTSPAPVVSGSYLSKKEGVYEIDVYPSSSSTGQSYRISGLETGTNSVNQSSPSSLGRNGLFLNFDSDYSYTNTEWIIPIPNTRSSTYADALNTYKLALAKRDASNSSNISRQISDAEIKQAEAEVARINAEISERILRAPFSGTISFVGPNKGESINAGDVAVSLISKDNYEIKVKVPEVDLSKVFENMKAEIVLDAYPLEKFSGFIYSINPAETIVDGVSVYEATIYLDNQDERIRSGMTANVSLVGETKENVLTIKKQFIEKDELGDFVYVYEDEEEIKTYIKTGLVGTDGSVEILSGLKEGDVIIGKFN